MSEPIEEGSTCAFRVEFFDASGDPVTPLTTRYRIKDLTNDRIVRDWTEIVSAQEIDVVVIASDNNIYRNARRRIEERSLVVQANHGTDSQYGREFLYRIRNQRGWQSDES